MVVPRAAVVAVVLGACGLGAAVGLARAATGEKPVELRINGVVRVRGGQAVLVLQEANGDRRLPIPISKAEASLIERGRHGLGPETIEALGGRILSACIDEASSRNGFRAHLSVGAGSREVQLDAAAGEALSLAVQAGAPIRVDRAVLDAAAVSPDDLRGRAAREVTRAREPAPVMHI